MAPTADEIEVLLGRAAAGDGRALAELFERHRDRLGRWSACGSTAGSRAVSTPPTSSRRPTSTSPDASRTTSPTRPCRSTSGCACSPARSWSTCTASTWGPRCATPARRSRSTAAPCRRRPRCRWPPSCWAGSPRPARPPSGPRRSSASRRRSTPWTRIDREVLVLRHFEDAHQRRDRRGARPARSAASNRYVRALKRLKAILAEGPGADAAGESGGTGPDGGGRLHDRLRLRATTRVGGAGRGVPRAATAAASGPPLTEYTAPPSRAGRARSATCSPPWC